MVEANPVLDIANHVLTPPFAKLFTKLENDVFDPEAVHETTEWLGLMALGSNRVLSEDRIDPYLSRYTAPDGSTESSTLRLVKWQGFIGSHWLTELLIACMSVSFSPSGSKASLLCLIQPCQS